MNYINKSVNFSVKINKRLMSKYENGLISDFLKVILFYYFLFVLDGHAFCMYMSMFYATFSGFYIKS